VQSLTPYTSVFIFLLFKGFYMNTEQFVVELAKLRSSSTFLSIKGYRSESGEVADYNIIFHMSYENALRKSILALGVCVPADDLEAQAKEELITSFSNSLKKIDEKSIEEIDDAYTRFKDSDGNYIKGCKLHTQSNTLHLYGLVVHKRVIISGTYKERNRRPLTIAKDNLKKYCPVNKFRQFAITSDKVESISVEHISILPPE
jgi:hypothetical protein